jgi:hypothetical protein
MGMELPTTVRPFLMFEVRAQDRLAIHNKLVPSLAQFLNQRD